MNTTVIFLCQTTLFRLLTLLLRFLTVILLWVLQWPSLYQKILIMLLSQFPLTLLQTQTRMLLFIAQLSSILVTDHLRDDPWEDKFNQGAFNVAPKFCYWIKVGIDVYIPCCKYRTKLHSSPWFPAACTAAKLTETTSFNCNKIISPSSNRLLIVAKGSWIFRACLCY